MLQLLLFTIKCSAPVNCVPFLLTAMEEKSSRLFIHIFFPPLASRKLNVNCQSSSQYSLHELHLLLTTVSTAIFFYLSVLKHHRHKNPISWDSQMLEAASLHLNLASTFWTFNHFCDWFQDPLQLCSHLGKTLQGYGKTVTNNHLVLCECP